MKTLQEKYNAIQEGSFSKEQFIRDARLQLPNLITQYNGYDDAVQILKNRGMIVETTHSDKEGQLRDAPVGARATGGGYGPFEKIKTNTWKNLKAGSLQHSEALARHIGGFDDFKITETVTEARLTKNSLTDYRYKPTNDMDKYPYEQILRGLRVELEGLNVTATPTPDEYKKALAKVLKNLEKDEIYYTNRIAGKTKKVDLHDKMVDATEKNTVDTFNGMKKAELKEGFKKLIKKVLSEDQERYERGADKPYGTEEEYEFYNSEESLKEEVEKEGLIIIGRTQADNNAIGEILDKLDLYGEWNTREGYWLLPEKEENYDELETILDQEFGKRGINARFEGIFNEEKNLSEGKRSLSELLK